MKKIIYILPGLFIVILVLFLVVSRKTSRTEKSTITVGDDTTQKTTQEETTASLANPASKYCEENGGKLEIVTNNDGTQFGLCQFEDYSCEEWAYMNGECNIEEDAEKIREALISKGLNLSQSKVVIYKHLGKYISGGVVPVDMLGGGGYVFAVKDGGQVKVLADGNGVIMCSSFDNYPDFPSYLVSECVDETGNIVTR